jgi:hypothetical protein
MARKRYKPEEIVAKLRQVDVLVSQGQNMVDAIRQSFWPKRQSLKFFLKRLSGKTSPYYLLEQTFRDAGPVAHGQISSGQTSSGQISRVGQAREVRIIK